ncbi:MAG TPA: ABC transporter permease subunit [Cerasibacillus sp.]|uniref:ABC transporter permease n=1 Tax=Cerasibacillus sp. TaxID=2498711 RepID=UPI002F3E221E
MVHILTIAKREIKLGFRNSWTYSFLILFTLFTIAILLLQSGVQSTEGYTDITGTMMNMTLYLLPLLTLLLGSVSVAVEKENGHWELLSTYALTRMSFLWGKWIGLSVILLTVLAFSFGVAGCITFLFGKSLSLGTLVFFWIFSSILTIIYLGISIAIGALAKSRWQALIGSIGVWFITIVIWPLLLISILSLLPYSMLYTILEVSTFLNPAELVRIFSMMKIGAGSVFGPEYNQWVTWANGPFGTPVFIGVVIIWIIMTIGFSAFIWERRDQRE